MIQLSDDLIYTISQFLDPQSLIRLSKTNKLNYNITSALIVPSLFISNFMKLTKQIESKDAYNKLVGFMTFTNKSTFHLAYPMDDIFKKYIKDNLSTILHETKNADLYKIFDDVGISYYGYQVSDAYDRYLSKWKGIKIDLKSMEFRDDMLTYYSAKHNIDIVCINPNDIITPIMILMKAIMYTKDEDTSLKGEVMLLELSSKYESLVKNETFLILFLEVLRRRRNSILRVLLECIMKMNHKNMKAGYIRYIFEILPSIEGINKIKHKEFTDRVIEAYLSDINLCYKPILKKYGIDPRRKIVIIDETRRSNRDYINMLSGYTRHSIYPYSEEVFENDHDEIQEMISWYGDNYDFSKLNLSKDVYTSFKSLMHILHITLLMI